MKHFHFKAVQIEVNNLIATHFKINGNYKKALKYIEYNLEVLQNFSFTNFNAEIKFLIQNHKINDELKNKEQQLKKQIQQSNYFKAFSTTAAHDLKAPLQTIAGFSNLIESSYISLSDEKAEKYLNLIIETSDNIKLYF